MAKARCRGDTIEVTRTVVLTRVKIAPSVIATMRMVVRIEAMIRFMVCGRDRRIAQWAENQNVRQAVDVWAPSSSPKRTARVCVVKAAALELRIYKSATLQISVNRTSRRLRESNQLDSTDHT